MTTKLNLEKKLENKRSILDKIDVVTHRDHLEVSPTYNSEEGVHYFTFNLSKSHYFSVDITSIYPSGETYSTLVSFNIIPIPHITRFEIMFYYDQMYPIYSNWGGENVFYDFVYGQPFFPVLFEKKNSVGNISFFKGIPDDDVYHYIGIFGGWRVYE